MVSISASVGKNGVNKQADVEAIQNLLNQAIAKENDASQKSLVVDKRIGQNTINTIIRFQKNIVGMVKPDGKIDPNGSTLKKLEVYVSSDNTSLIQLPKSGNGYYVYTTSDKLWGTKECINSITAAAKSFKDNHNITIGIGDISFGDKREMFPHKSHRKGLNIDIRPLRKDGKHLPISIHDKDHYSQELTKALVEILQNDSNLKSILFNDSGISGVKQWAGHHNHLHVSFKK